MKAILLALLLVGCATDSKQSQPTIDPSKKPVVGMSKDQVLAMHGKPKRVTLTAQGEVWRYDNYELMMIPFNFGFRPKVHEFVFGADGKLASFSQDDF